MYQLLVTTVVKKSGISDTVVGVHTIVLKFDTMGQADFAYKEITWNPNNTERTVERLYRYDV